MLNGDDKKFYNTICNTLGKCSNPNKKGEFFYRVPVTIVNELRKNGYVVEIVNPHNIPDMEDGKNLHFIFVHYK